MRGTSCGAVVKMGQIFFPSLALLPTLQWCLYTRRDADATALSLGPRLVGSCLDKDIDSSPPPPPPPPPSRVLKEPCVHAIDFSHCSCQTDGRPRGAAGRTDGFSVRECSRLRRTRCGQFVRVKMGGSVTPWVWVAQAALAAGRGFIQPSSSLLQSLCSAHICYLERGRTDGRRPRKSGGGVKLGPSGAVFFFCSFSFSF